MKSGMRHESTGNSRKNKFFGFTLVALLALLFNVLAEAGEPTNIPRIGVIFNTPASDPSTVRRRDAFREGLQDLGYIEGNTIKIEYRYVEGRSEQLNKSSEELIRSNVNILVVPNDLTARAAKETKTNLPIVMASSGNPIGTGVIASLARPGGNVTGLTSYSPELFGKRLEILKEAFPKIIRVAFLNDGTRSGVSASMAAFKEAEGFAKALGVRLQSVGVKEPIPDFAAAFRVIARDRIDALITSPGPLMSFHRKTILQLVEQNRLPAIHPAQDWASGGGLISYGANVEDQYRRAAVYVDKILKGAKPADLPVEQPRKFELVINLKTAKQIGLIIPPNVLARADRIVR
jgi:putative ABC transport system substrate-binding protein